MWGGKDKMIFVSGVGVEGRRIVIRQSTILQSFGVKIVIA